jgi:hypothetical protein
MDTARHELDHCKRGKNRRALRILGNQSDFPKRVHGYTDGSRRTAASFGWTLLRFNSKGKQHEIAWNTWGNLKLRLMEK